MHEYGLALLHGDGMSQERDEALYWIRKAADYGDETAKEFLLA
ncbi:SEL1-like repeat protein [Stenotrophomonas humi]